MSEEIKVSEEAIQCARDYWTSDLDFDNARTKDIVKGETK